MNTCTIRLTISNLSIKFYAKEVIYMDRETTGTVVSVAKQWWLKISTKPIRLGPLDGAIFPHIIKVAYIVDGNAYTKRKWISVGKPVPTVGSTLAVLYCSNKPNKSKILY